MNVIRLENTSNEFRNILIHIDNDCNNDRDNNDDADNHTDNGSERQKSLKCCFILNTTKCRDKFK
jgi:hypothetical protein